MPDRPIEARLKAGTVIAGRELRTVAGAPVAIPDPERLVHLQFRRFAGCPICNLHLHSMIQRRDEIAAANIREIVVFHSTAEEMRVHAADLPFPVIADPDKRLYVEFGVESAPRALLDPRAWIAILRSIPFALRASIVERKPLPPTHPRGGRLGLPADFLIAQDGRVLDAKYGDHADDQWSVDELLSLAPPWVGRHAAAPSESEAPRVEPVHGSRRSGMPAPRSRKRNSLERRKSCGRPLIGGS
jgi:peroxiredoxin